MKNPIPYTGMFHTPDSHTDLMDWIGQHSGTERMIAMVAAHMALNLAHAKVEEMLLKQDLELADALGMCRE